MHKIEIELPKIVEVMDYHEFDYLKLYLSQIGLKGVKVEEIGFNGNYIGIVYKKKDEDYKKLVEKYKEEEEEFFYDSIF